jgi:hypothetical protein
MKRNRSLFAGSFALLLAAVSPMAAQTAAQPDPVSSRIMKLDDDFRIAKLKNDAAALTRILADGFHETNQNGNTRDKAQTIELWQSFHIGSLSTDSSQVRLAGDFAFVTGTQTEDGDHMIFSRVYAKSPEGWRLLSATQFRSNPAPAEEYQRQLAALRGTDAEVMKVDDGFRLAKLHHDTAALNRILADGFYETNQNGNSRNKAEMIELFRDFPISSLLTESFQVRVSGANAIVSGTQTESGMDHMLFTRVYSKGPNGWQLLSSTQFLNPNFVARTF